MRIVGDEAKAAEDRQAYVPRRLIGVEGAGNRIGEFGGNGIEALARDRQVPERRDFDFDEAADASGRARRAAATRSSAQVPGIAKLTKDEMMYLSSDCGTSPQCM